VVPLLLDTTLLVDAECGVGLVDELLDVDDDVACINVTLEV
jgi:hypothetical protein